MDGFCLFIKEAGGRKFHLGLRTLFVVCSLSPKTMISWLGL